MEIFLIEFFILRNKICVYNSVVPVIPFWQELQNISFGYFFFVASSKFYRKNEWNETPLIGKFFSVPSFSGYWLIYIIKTLLFLPFCKVKSHLFFSQPPLFFIVGLFMKKIRGDRYIIHIMDVYPEILNKIYSKKGVPNILSKWINSLTVKALEEAELIIVIGQCMAKYLNNLNIDQNKIFYFPNFSGVKSKIVPEKDSNKLKLVYAGNIGVGHSLTSIIEAAISLREKVELFIITNEKGKKYVEGILTGNYYSNIYLLTNISDDKFEYHLNSASFHFVSLKSEFTGLMVPSKYYSALKLGIPVIYEGSKNSEIFLDISKSKLGFAFEEGDINSLNAFLKNVISGTTFFDRNEILNYYFENYEISHRIGSYVETIKNAFKY